MEIIRILSFLRLQVHVGKTNSNGSFCFERVSHLEQLIRSILTFKLHTYDIFYKYVKGNHNRRQNFRAARLFFII